MSQCAAILEWLEAGNTLTPAEAYEKFGTLALHSRISELRAEGWNIVMHIRTGNGKRWGEYQLADDGILAEQEQNYNRMIGESLRR